MRVKHFNPQQLCSSELKLFPLWSENRCNSNSRSDGQHSGSSWRFHGCDFCCLVGCNSVSCAFQPTVEWLCSRGAVFHLREVALSGFPGGCVTTASKALWTHVFTWTSASLLLGMSYCVPVSRHSKKTHSFHCSGLLFRKQVPDSQSYILPASLANSPFANKIISLIESKSKAPESLLLTLQLKGNTKFHDQETRMQKSSISA